MVTFFNDETVKAVREQSIQSDRTGVPMRLMLDTIYEQGLFKLFVPEALGGRMCSLPDALRIYEEASRIDGNFGWLITIGAGGGFFAPFIEPPVSERMFAPRDAVIAGSGTAGGTAKRVEGGYVASGRWKFCSGSTHATVFTANCIVEEEGARPDGNPEVRSFVFWPDQVHIVRDWNAFGLKATESHTIEVTEAFVPEEMTFSIFSDHYYYDHPVYRYPFLQFAQATFAAVAAGIGRHFFEEAREVLRQKREAWQGADRYEFVRQTVERHEERLRHSVAEFYDTLNASWTKHAAGDELSDEELQRVSRQCHQTARAALQGAQSVFPYMGIGAVMEDAPINRIWRDLHTACQHSLLVPFYEL